MQEIVGLHVYKLFKLAWSVTANFRTSSSLLFLLFLLLFFAVDQQWWREPPWMLRGCRRPDPAARLGSVHPGPKPSLCACVEHLLVPSGPLESCLIGRLVLAHDVILSDQGSCLCLRVLKYFMFLWMSWIWYFWILNSLRLIEFMAPLRLQVPLSEMTAKKRQRNYKIHHQLYLMTPEWIN